MPRKINRLQLFAPVAEPKPYTFKDIQAPDLELELWLRPLDPIERNAIQPRMWELNRIYVTGGWWDDGEKKTQDKPLPLHAVRGPDGAGVLPKLNLPFLATCAQLELMQEPPDPDDKYEAFDLFYIALGMPNAWLEVEAKLDEFASGKIGWKGKVLPGPTEKLSQPSSDPVTDTPLSGSPSSKDSTESSKERVIVPVLGSEHDGSPKP